MQVITPRRARAICKAVTDKLDGYAALRAFSASGEIQIGFLLDTRVLEADKATLLTERRIDQDTYWNIVSLSVFAEYHADEGFSSLRTAFDKQQSEVNAQ